MSLAIVYLSMVAFITFIICLLYVRSIISHNEELTKINKIEESQRQKEDELRVIRSRIKKCPIDASDPRSCYFKSNYKCSWSEEGNMCALK